MKKLGVILFILIISYFIFLIRQDIINNLELKREIVRVTKSIEQDEVRAKQLEDRLRNLKDRKYIEKLARTKLGMVKKDETAYKVLGR